MAIYTNPTSRIGTEGDDTFIFTAWPASFVSLDALGGWDRLEVTAGAAPGPVDFDVKDWNNSGSFDARLKSGPYYDTEIQGWKFEDVLLHGTAAADSFRLKIGDNSLGLEVDFRGGAGDDYLFFDWSAVTGDMTFDGSGGTITSSFGQFSSFEKFDIRAGAGDDVITTGALRDIVHTGAGVDVVSTGAGDDTIYSLSDGGFVDGGAGYDWWSGGNSASNAAITTMISDIVTMSYGLTVLNVEDVSVGTGSGDDLFIVNRWKPGGGSGGTGFDTVVFDGIAITRSLNFNILTYADGTFNAGVSDGSGFSTSFNQVENLDLRGSDLDDTFSMGGIWTPEHVNFAGRGGRDLLHLNLSSMYGATSFIVAPDGTITTGRGQFADFEHFTLSGGEAADTFVTGSGNDGLYGAGGDDILTSGAGYDSLNGGAGADIMTGGAGDDNYFVNESGDQVVEELDGGVDRVSSEISYSLPAHVDDIQLQWAASAVNATGNDLSNLITGNQYNNTLSGGAGDDWLDGQAGDDTLTGGEGSDVLVGGSGFNVFSGGAGSDRFLISSWSQTITDFSAQDRIYLDANLFTASPVGPLATSAFRVGASATTLSHRVIYNPSTGALRYDYDGSGSSPSTVIAMLPTGLTLTATNFFVGYEHQVQSATSYTMVLGEISLTLTGTAAINGFGDARNNSISGNNAANLLEGNAGHDTLQGYGGDDTLNGGPGVDTMRGGAGDDKYTVEDSRDTVEEIAGEGADHVTASVSFVLGANVENLTLSGISAIDGRGNELANILTGNNLANRLYGYGESDILAGQDGNDILDGGTGNDTIDGGLGTDEFVFTAGGGQDTIKDLNAGEIVRISGYVSAQSITQAGENVILVFSATDQIIFEHTSITTVQAALDFSTVVNGTSDDETLVGTSGNDKINGLEGNDTFHGGLGHDTLDGGAGTDIADYSSAPGGVTVSLLLAGAQDTGGAGTDTLIGIENLKGSSHNDVLIGDAGSNLFDLRNGGSDSVSGGEGNDGFYFGGAYTSADSVDGGAGSLDQIGLQGNYSGGVTLGTLSGVELVVLLRGGDTRFGLSGTDLFSYNLTATDGSVAAGGNLILQANTLQAGENFTFNGAAEMDGTFTVYGGYGVDTFTGGSGGDGDGFFFGQGRFGASDVVNGGGSAMDQIGFQGNFTGCNAIAFGAAQLTNVEFIVLLSAVDTRFGADGGTAGYQLTMHDGNVASGQRMIISANNLKSGEWLNFNGSAETNGSFRIFSGASSDIISGSQTGDEIYGGGGADVLRGNGGADQFVYIDIAHSSAYVRDWIEDFTPGSDKLNLATIDANQAFANGINDAFSFIGAQAFSGVAGQLRAQDTNAGYWVVQGDVDGDGVADFAIDVVMATGQPITAADILL